MRHLRVTMIKSGLGTLICRVCGGPKKCVVSERCSSCAQKIAMNRPEVKKNHRKALMKRWGRVSRPCLSPDCDSLTLSKSGYCRRHERSVVETCPKCGGPIQPISRLCRSCSHIESMSGPNNHNWRGGRSREPYSPEFSQSLRKKILDRDDHLCQMPDCYLPENGKKHDVHHIDYDKKNCTLVNLITLCRSHNIKVNHGDRERWTEYFQCLQRLRGIQ